MSKDPKVIVAEMLRLVGKRETERLLVEHKISPSVAGKLARGKYEYQLGELMADAVAKARLAAEKKPA